MTIIQPLFTPPGMSILEAMSRGVIPANIQVTSTFGGNVGAGNPNPTLLSLLSSGNAGASAFGPPVTPPAAIAVEGQLVTQPAGQQICFASPQQAPLSGQPSLGNTVGTPVVPMYGGN